MGCVSAPSDTATFSVMTYNIRHGADIRNDFDLSRAARVIAAAKPRFAGLQEIDQKTARVGGRDTCAILSSLTGMEATFAKGIDYDGGEYGVALLSEEKPLSVKRFPLPGKEPRVLLLCEFRDCWVGVTHLDLTEAARRESVAVLAREVRSRQGKKSVFLMGDWNAKPSSRVLAEVRRFATILSPQTTATYQHLPFTEEKRRNGNYCIDYIAVDTPHATAYEILDARVVEDRTSSDHAPVLVTLRKK
jgi:endonuclease/exonuclease/phosphatase family metal-dependent hydrolase